ncbi:MAG: hypothetical protein ABSF03_05095 [Streptosporangiaceae bacterium]|jgi:hypothetical protein
MSGRDVQSEDFTLQLGAPGGNKGLWTRLNSRASGTTFQLMWVRRISAFSGPTGSSWTRFSLSAR